MSRDATDGGGRPAEPAPAATDDQAVAFVARWLALRAREPAAAPAAGALAAEVPDLFLAPPPGGAPTHARRFLVEVGRRFAALRGWSAVLSVEAIPDGSSPGRWARAARRAGETWPDPPSPQWSEALCRLAGDRNAVAAAAVAESLLDASAAGSGRRARRVAGLAAELLAVDAREFVRAPIPPAPGAPWEPEAYLLPGRDRAVLVRVAEQVAALAPQAPAPVLAPVQALLKQSAEGWPVSLARLLTLLDALAAAIGPSAAAAIDDAVGLLRVRDPDAPSSVAAPAPADQAAGVPHPACRALIDLAAELAARATEEERAFAARVAALASDPEAPRGPAFRHGLSGCLVYLDGLAAVRGDWPRQVLGRLLSACRPVPGFVVLDASTLLGAPIADRGDFAAPVGYADQADAPSRSPAGPGHRIARVETPGAAWSTPGGPAEVIIRARVLLVP